MPTRFYILGGAVFAFAVAHDINTQVKARANGRLYLEVIEKFEEIEKANEAQIRYLCQIIDNSSITIDEFDLIALNFHN